MPIHITVAEAAWFLPFVFPVCLWVIWSDLSAMRIPNTAVVTLTGIFLVVGLLALPLPEYPWRLLNLVIVLVIGMVANAGGLMGAGDSKFLAAAAPFIDPDDLMLLFMIFSVNLVACYITHRVAKHSPIRRMAPDWESWSRGNKFPMGFALGSTLVIYLGLGLAFGP